MKASEAASIVTVMPQVLRNAVVKLENKNSYMENEEIAAACKALKMNLPARAESLSDLRVLNRLFVL